jgi:hypothetical protein
MRPDPGPRSSDVAASRASQVGSRCDCCGLPANQPVCAACIGHVDIDISNAEQVARREADHRDRWMQALALARRQSFKDKEQVAAALRSRNRYRDALRQLWHWHEPKPNAASPRHCSCGSDWPCRTAELVDKTVGEWAAEREREEILQEQFYDREYQRSLNPPPSDLRPYRPRKR